MLLLLVMVAVGAFTYLWLQGPERHADGDGQLASNEGGHEAMSVDRVPGVTSWTYGLRLCIGSGDAPAILESVSPGVAVGSGFRFLGAGVREWTPTSSHEAIISVAGWPPPASFVPDEIHDIPGFAVSTSCATGPRDPYTELLVGLGLVSADGGGWQGIEVGYHVGGRHRVLLLNHDLLICGASVDCSVPGEPSAMP
jgi:hypothetical protein